MTYLRLFIGQLLDRTVPLKERWLRAHRMGMCGSMIVKGPPYRKLWWM